MNGHHIVKNINLWNLSIIKNFFWEFCIDPQYIHIHRFVCTFSIETLYFFFSFENKCIVKLAKTEKCHSPDGRNIAYLHMLRQKPVYIFLVPSDFIFTHFTAFVFAPDL